MKLTSKIKNTVSKAKNHVKNSFKNVKSRYKAIKLIAQFKAQTGLRSLRMGRRGTSMTSKIVGISIGLLVAAIILPIAVDELVAVDTSSWPSAVGTVMTILLPVLGVIGIALALIRKTDLT